MNVAKTKKFGKPLRPANVVAMYKQEWLQGNVVSVYA